jgi:hypothetical protein
MLFNWILLQSINLEFNFPSKYLIELYIEKIVTKL